MTYIIIWNQNNIDNCIHQEIGGFIGCFESKEEARQEAEKCVDGGDFREFEIYKTVQ